jgi:predicted nucleic acid-binding protein
MSEQKPPDRPDQSRYLLDTSAINHLDDRAVDQLLSLHLPLFVTHAQADELQATRNPEKANRLHSVFRAIAAEETPTPSAVWDVSKIEKALWSDEDGMFEEMLARLQELDTTSKRPKNPANQTRDILIAETALKNGLTLVTDDANLLCVTIEFGGSAITLAQLLQKGRCA